MLISNIIDKFDKELIIFINNNFTYYPFLLFFNIITIFGTYTFLWLILYIYFSPHKKNIYIWIFFIIGFLLSFSISVPWLKELFARTRPFNALPDINIIASKPSSYAFPSGHATMAAVGFYIIKKIEKNRETVTIVFFLSVLIALSRVILKVHYLTDIVAGYFLGIIIPFIVYTFIKKFFKFNNC